MKIVQINSTCKSGSIGKICQAISSLLTAKGIENYILYSRGESSCKQAIRYSKSNNTKLPGIKAKLFGNYGFSNNKDTYRLINQLNLIKPDIVHIHNIHAHNCNFEILFEYLRSHHIRVFYTFHDCWAFTGYCMYFDSINCTKWKDGCNRCPQYKKYSWFFDRCNKLYEKKKRALSNLNLTIITPSQWLANLTKESFLAQYPIKVINNGIDLNVFKPIPSNFREKYNCSQKFLILGIASKWEVRKGLDTFIHLANDLDNSFQIVLVGTTFEIDKHIPSNIISIHRTEGQRQLAEIYSACDVLVNPTMEENFPTVNIESIACGTPVITYNTGGSAEMIDDTCGIILEKGNYQALLKSIIEYETVRNLNSLNCVEHSRQYSQNEKFQEYVNLYSL